MSRTCFFTEGNEGNRGQRTEDGGQRTEDGGQRTEDRGRRTDDGGQRTDDRVSWGQAFLIGVVYRRSQREQTAEDG